MQFKVLGEGESQRTFIVVLAPKKPWLQRLNVLSANRPSLRPR